MPFDPSQYRKIGENNPPPTTTSRPISNRPFVNPNQDSWNLSDYAAPLIRGAAGLAPGGIIGAGASGGAELLAQIIEERPNINWATVGAEAGLGFIPFRAAGKIGSAALKGGLLSGSSTALRQQTERGLHLPDVEEGKEIALGTTIGAGGGALAGALASKFKTKTLEVKANKEVSKAVAQATDTKTPTRTTPGPEIVEGKSYAPKLERNKTRQAKLNKLVNDPNAEANLKNIVAEVAEVKTPVVELPKKFDSPKLPRELKGASPNYGTQKLKWENDIDKALFIIAGKNKSASHDKYVEFLTKYTGLTEKELKPHGLELRKSIGQFIKASRETGSLEEIVNIPRFNKLEIAYTPKGIKSKAPNKAGTFDPATGRRINDTGNSSPNPSNSPVANIAKDQPEVKLTDDQTPEVDLIDTGYGMLQRPKYPKKPELHEPHLIRKIAAEGRQLQTSLDLSFPFRQGITNWTRKEFWDSFKPMFKSLKSQADFDALKESIVNHPAFELMQKAGLEFPGLGRLSDEAEEAISRHTWVGKHLAPIKASNRAYEAFSDNLRKNTFLKMADDAKKAGIVLIGENGKITENARAIARYVNDGTGRGSLGKLEKNAAVMNDLFFSPKLMMSRINMLRRAFQDPRMVKGADSALATQLRRKAIRDMMGVGGLALTSMGISAANDEAQASMDPSSTDFGKIKIGNTRLDLTGGFQSYLRLVTQLASGKSNLFGQTQDRNRYETAERFARSKAAPLASLIMDFMAEKNVIGEKFTWDKAFMERMTPLIIQDIIEVSKEEGPIGVAAVTVPSIFGAGVQSYGKNATTKRRPIGRNETFSLPQMPKVNLP